MGPSRLLRKVLVIYVISLSSPSILWDEDRIPAKLFDTRTSLPSFCPSSTPTTRFRVPFAERP